MTLLKLFFLPIFFASALSLPPNIPNLNLTPDDVNKILQVLSQNADFLKLEKEEQTAVVNEYAEILLNNLSGFIQEKLVGPIPLPDVGGPFNVLVFKGELSFKNGVLKDLNSLKRVEDVVVSYSYPNFKLHLPMSFTLLAFQYKYKAEAIGLHVEGTMDGTAKGTIYTIDIALDLTTLKAKLSDFKLNRMGEVKPHFEGGLAGHFINAFSSLIIKWIPGIVEKVLNGLFANTAAEYIDKYNEILEKILGPSQF